MSNRDLTLLYKLLNTPGLTSLQVQVRLAGEVTIVASGPSAMDRMPILLKTGIVYDLLTYAPVSWFSSNESLDTAVRSGWISLVTDAAAVLAPAQTAFLPLVVKNSGTAIAGSVEVINFSSGLAAFVGTDGTVTVVAADMSLQTLTYAASVNLDFDPAISPYREITLAGNLTLTTSNLGSSNTVRSMSVTLIGDGTTRNLVFPVGWTFLGSSAPATLPAGKTAQLSLTSRGATDSRVIAAYAAQP